jgi:hypothetical protein
MFVPGKEGKRDNDRLFQVVDVPATILSLLNIPVPQSWVGRNMLDPRESGRDFVVLLSTLSDGIVGVLQKSGVKYVRNKPNEPMVSYQTNRDPYEQIPLPISKETELEIEKIIDTYLYVATQGWESKKMSNDLFSQSYLGAEIARNWGNDPCIEIMPDELKKITLVHPVVKKECQNADAFARAIYKMIPSELIGQESRLEFNVMLLRNEEIQGKQPQSLVKIWGMEQPIALSLQPIANIWQTVSVVLPKFKSSIDPAISQKQNDVFLAIVPVDLPIYYAVGYIVVKPANTNIKQTLRHWSLRFKQYLSKVF